MGKGNHRATEAQRGEREEKRKLPEGWEEKKLGEVCVIKTGKKDVNEGNPNGKYPFFTCARTHTYSDSFSFDTEALLIAGNGDVGHVQYYKGKFEAYQRTYVLSDFKSIYTRFLYLILDGYLADAVSKQKLGNTMPYIKMGTLTDFILPLPPPPEQKRIVAILDEAFAVIGKARENAEKNLDNAREIFESGLSGIFSYLATKHGNFKLEDVVEKECTLSYGIVQPGDDFCNGLPIVRPTDLIVKHIKLDGLKRINPKLAEPYQRTTLTGNEILLCVRGSTGTVAISTKELAGSNVTRGIVPICFDSRKVLLDFGYYLFNSPFIQKQIKEKTYGTALMQINIADLRKIDIIAPPLLEQRRIVTELDALSAQTAKLEAVYRKKIADLDELKASILERAFRGEL